MEPHADHYAILGVKPDAPAQAITNAYRNAARRFHPDANPDPGAADEIKRINQAYEVLRDPESRAAYDRARAAADHVALDIRLTTSRHMLPILDEPQVVYGLVRVGTNANGGAAAISTRSLLNLCVVVDRSTSMRGKRLDLVMAGLCRIIEDLQPQDALSVVSFSDRAEVVLPAATGVNKARAVSRVSAIHAGGGTEILQGLVYGMTELHREFGVNKINHLLLLTDGQTYGDEDDCLLLAQMAAGDGIGISAVGIGDEWNDVFVDRLAAVTGGYSDYVAEPETIGAVLAARVRALATVFAERLRLQVAPDNDVRIRNVTRVSPEPQQFDAATRLFKLGGLSNSSDVAVLVELELPPLRSGYHSVARLSVLADLISTAPATLISAVDIRMHVLRDAPTQLPPEPITDALSKIVLYQLQDKAWRLAKSGDVQAATRMLSNLAERLEANGESELAEAAADQSAQLRSTHTISPEGQKQLKYGTRALIAPPVAS
ncbi:MAG: DnaJ domain-containing protein [Anaerolineales bacterium]